MPITYKVDSSRVQAEISLMIEEMEMETDYLLRSINIDIKKKILAGATKKQATAEALKEFAAGEGPAKAWLNKQNRKINELEKNTIAMPSEMYANENPKMKFNWVLGSVKTSHCPDCIKLSNMEARTIKEWRALGYGLPREGGTICNVGCQCMLQEAK